MKIIPAHLLRPTVLAFISTLELITSAPCDPSSWIPLFSFARDHLRDPPNRSSAATAYATPRNLEQRVTSCLNAGDSKGAARAISPTSSMAPVNKETFQKLLKLHPTTFPAVSPSALHRHPPENFTITDSSITIAVVVSLRSPSGSGPDGLRGSHLKAFKQYCLSDTSELNLHNRLVNGLTQLCNLLFDGSLPEPLHQIFSCATLIALNKPGGSVRPVAIGLIIRRLASKIAANHVRKSHPDLLLPQQFPTFLY